MGLSSIPLTTLIEFGLGDSRYRRRCGVRFINVFWSLLASIMILVYCNVPTGSATASTFSSDGFTQFQCSDAGYSIADSSGSTGGTAGRSRFAQSPAAIALLKSMLKEQKLAEVRKTPSSIFLKECGCQHDWMSAFCLRADKYKTMDVVKAPTVCICRLVFLTLQK
uniref:Uncharacterized protein n=1 Tax=Ditylenchus dipsaci TaxID=166011 RepID=A0A915DUB8_9BILA